MTKIYKIVRTEPCEGLPEGATEVFIRRDISKDTMDAITDLLYDLGFDCMDTEEDEEGDTFTEIDGHRFNYYARVGVLS